MIAPAAAAPTPGPTRRARPLMATLVAVAVRGPDPASEERIVEALFGEMGRLAGIFSEFEPRSAVSAVNAAAGRSAVVVPPELLEVVAAALDVARASAGAFDPTWLPLAECWRFDGVARLPAEGEVSSRLRDVSYADLVLDLPASTVLLRRPGMRLGLGGIAKAFIAERAAELALALGASGVLVDAGGDVVARGSNGDRGWRVAVRDPRHPGIALGSLELHDATLATSGDAERCFVAGGRRYHHLLDPRTGHPARGARSVSVLAPRGAEADALATALFVLGPDAGARLLAGFPEASALWVPDEA